MWENAQQGSMKMALAATTYAQSARLDLYTMQLAQGLPDPKTRTTPLPKPWKEAKDSPTTPGPPTTQEAPPPLLPQNKKSAEPEKVEKSEICVLRRAGCYCDYGGNQRYTQSSGLRSVNLRNHCYLGRS
jgi:hypothetical protein